MKMHEMFKEACKQIKSMKMHEMIKKALQTFENHENT